MPKLKQPATLETKFIAWAWELTSRDLRRLIARRRDGLWQVLADVRRYRPKQGTRPVWRAEVRGTNYFAEALQSDTAMLLAEQGVFGEGTKKIRKLENVALEEIVP